MDTARFFSEFQYRAPSEGELTLLNAFIASTKDSPSRFAAASISANDAFIAKPLFDLMKKRRALHPDESRICSVDQSLMTVAEAVDLNKVKDFSLSDRKVFLASSDDEAKLKAILGGYEPEFCENGVCIAKNTYNKMPRKALRFNKEYSVVIIYKNDTSSPEALLDFAKKLVKSKRAIAITASKGKDVFSSIYSMSKKLTVRAERLITDLNEILEDPFSITAESLFTDSRFGSVALAVVCKKIHAYAICKAATKAHLEYSTAIKISKEPKFKLYSGNQLLTEMKQDIFYCSASPRLLEIAIPNAPVTDSPLPEVSKACEFPDGDAVYTTKVELSEAAYQNASLALVAPLISAAFDGYNEKNCGFSLAFDLRANLKGKEKTAKVYSALSAIYRVAMELGYPIDSVNTSIPDGESSLSVCLRIAPFGKKATLSTGMSKETVRKFAFEDRAYPDISVIKDLLGG